MIRLSLMRTVCSALLILAFITTDAFGAISARLDKTQVYVGDSVTLEITVEGPSQGHPNLEPLRKDFEVIGTGSGSQVQIINGKRRDSRTWNIRLQPKSDGWLLIPPVSVGSEKTPALSLKIIEISSGSSTEEKAVFLKAEVVEDSVYVQQQVQLITRLYHQRRLLSGEWSAPKIEDVVMESLGEGREYQETRDGRIYQVIERRYAIFPERSGELTIPFTRFAGEVEIPQPRAQQDGGPKADPRMERFFGHDPFADDFFNRSPFARVRGKSVRALSPELVVEVRPVPDNLQSAHWLPAASVLLSDSWDDQAPDFSSGEPVTRVIVVEAKGLAASQVPELKNPDIPEANVYVEPPVTSTRTDGQWVFARSKQTVTYLPHKNGSLMIPEIRLDWWNTGKDAPDSSSLQQWTVTVSGLPEVEAKTEVSPTLDDAQGKFSDDTSEAVDDSTPVSETGFSFWWFAVMALLAGVASLLYRVFGRSGEQGDGSGIGGLGNANDQNRKMLLKHLRESCSANNPSDTRDALLRLAKQQWPDHQINSLQALAYKIESANEELLNLDRVLYGSVDSVWEGAEFWVAVKDQFTSTLSQRIQKNSLRLAELYPQK